MEPSSSASKDGVGETNEFFEQLLLWRGRGGRNDWELGCSWTRGTYRQVEKLSHLRKHHISVYLTNDVDARIGNS